MKPNLTRLLRSVSCPKLIQQGIKYAAAHDSELLTAAGIGLAWTGLVVSIKQTPKALRLIDIEERKKKEALTNFEIVKTCWKVYAPAFFAEAMASICLIASTRSGLRRNAALMAAYTLSETNLKEYREAVEKEVSEKKIEKIERDVAETKVSNAQIAPGNIIQTGLGDDLFLEPISGRTFWASANAIKSAVNNVNAMINTYGEASLNDLYNELRLKETEIMGENMGWSLNNNGLISFHLEGDISVEYGQKPVAVIVYNNPPVYGYSQF